MVALNAKAQSKPGRDAMTFFKRQGAKAQRTVGRGCPNRPASQEPNIRQAPKAATYTSPGWSDR